MFSTRSRALALSLCAAVTFAATSADAATFTLQDYTVSLHDADPGLVVYASDILAPDFSFTLNNVGDHTGWVDLFRIGTTEQALNGDDLAPYPIDVAFTFSAPPPPFGGNSTGVTGAGWFLVSFGYVSWSTPAAFAFGHYGDGRLGVWLDDAAFGLPGSAVVRAKFKLLKDATPPPAGDPVPEPTSVVLTGLGLAAAALVRRRR